MPINENNIVEEFKSVRMANDGHDRKSDGHLVARPATKKDVSVGGMPMVASSGPISDTDQ